MAFIPKVQPYAVITLDLNTARSLTPQGSITLSNGTVLTVWKANQLLVNAISTGATLSIALQDGAVAGGLTTASAGLKFNGINFNDIFFTNVSQAGKTAEIIITYTD